MDILVYMFMIFLIVNFIMGITEYLVRKLMH